MIRRRLAMTLCGMILLGTGPIAAKGAKLAVFAVSPGGSDGMQRLHTSCPTFSWTLVDEAEGYEILVYRLDREAGEPGSPPRLERRFPRGASTWTASGSDCLAPGEPYLWVVRGVVGGEPMDWSEARTFEIAPSPSAEDVQRALSILARLQERDPAVGGGWADRPSVGVGRASKQRESAPVEPAASSQRVSVNGIAAILGHQSDPSGDTVGVVGTVDSGDGAGVAAANTAGGVDLLLDGSADTETDTFVLQSGIDRSSGDPETFEIRNSGAGDMTLLIDGMEAVTTATDSDTLGGLACAENQIAQWNGSSWVCATNQGGDTLAGLSCTDGQIVHWNGAAWACGQPDLQFETCGPAGNCSMSCPAGTVVWVGGCDVTSGSPSSLSENRPTSGGAGQPPTGWACAGVNPIGGVSVVGYLYCIGQ